MTTQRRKRNPNTKVAKQVMTKALGNHGNANTAVGADTAAGAAAATAVEAVMTKRRVRKKTRWAVSNGFVGGLNLTLMTRVARCDEIASFCVGLCCVLNAHRRTCHRTLCQHPKPKRWTFFELLWGDHPQKKCSARSPRNNFMTRSWRFVLLDIVRYTCLGSAVAHCVLLDRGMEMSSLDTTKNLKVRSQRLPSLMTCSTVCRIARQISTIEQVGRSLIKRLVEDGVGDRSPILLQARALRSLNFNEVEIWLLQMLDRR